MSGVMKIAMLNTGRGWGGAEEQMLSMSLELENRGYSITVICRRGSPVEKRFTECGLQVLPVARKGLRAVVDPFLTALQARREKFHIIHSTVTMICRWASCWLWQVGGAPPHSALPSRQAECPYLQDCRSHHHRLRVHCLRYSGQGSRCERLPWRYRQWY